jgi:hypothetical protein
MLKLFRWTQRLVDRPWRNRASLYCLLVEFEARHALFDPPLELLCGSSYSASSSFDFDGSVFPAPRRNLSFHSLTSAIVGPCLLAVAATVVPSLTVVHLRAEPDGSLPSIADCLETVPAWSSTSMPASPAYLRVAPS